MNDFAVTVFDTENKIVRVSPYRNRQHNTDARYVVKGDHYEQFARPGQGPLTEIEPEGSFRADAQGQARGQSDSGASDALAQRTDASSGSVDAGATTTQEKNSLLNKLDDATVTAIRSMAAKHDLAYEQRETLCESIIDRANDREVDTSRMDAPVLKAFKEITGEDDDGGSTGAQAPLPPRNTLLQVAKQAGGVKGSKNMTQTELFNALCDSLGVAEVRQRAAEIDDA